MVSAVGFFLLCVKWMVCSMMDGMQLTCHDTCARSREVVQDNQGTGGFHPQEKWSRGNVEEVRGKRESKA